MAEVLTGTCLYVYGGSSVRLQTVLIGWLVGLPPKSEMDRALTVTPQILSITQSCDDSCLIHLATIGLGKAAHDDERLSDDHFT